MNFKTSLQGDEMSPIFHYFWSSSMLKMKHLLLCSTYCKFRASFSQLFFSCLTLQNSRPYQQFWKVRSRDLKRSKLTAFTLPIKIKIIISNQPNFLSLPAKVNWKKINISHLGAKIHILANTVPKNSFSWKSNIFGGFITWNLIFRHEKIQNSTI